MRGLLRNNFYVTLADAKAFTVVAVLLGVFVVAMDNAVPSLLISYLMLVMIGFPFSSAASIRKESATKWEKYKLAVGITFAGMGVALSVALHGYPFDKDTDIFMLFVTGIAVSLFVGAVFFPMYFLGGEERSTVIMIVSLLGGIGIFMGLTTLVNKVYPENMTARQIVLSGIFMMICSAAAFAASCPVTVGIFRRKEY